MTSKRRSLTPTEEIALMTQVRSECPLCGDPLFYRKATGRYHKIYEIAHIFPLNPRQSETIELDGVEKLSADPNHVHNLIPLCVPCHTKFDNPRTRSEYEELLELKRSFINQEKLQELQAQYGIEDHIVEIIASLHAIDAQYEDVELEYEPKRLDEKFDDSMPYPTATKIRHYVADYYSHIKRSLGDVEKRDPDSANLISAQVKTYYLAQKRLALPQHVVFLNMVNWIRSKSKSETQDAVEIVAAFFIQNCEIFE